MATKVVNQQTTTYTWDFRDKMVEVDFPEGDDVSLRYDGAGNRYRKVVGSTTTKFLFDTNNLRFSALLFELDGGETVQAKYRRGPSGLLLAMKRGRTLYAYHFDAIGSTRALTNASGTTTDTYEYDAWGTVTQSSGSTTNRARYVGALGYYDDADAGAMLLGARWYGPGAGRFASADPLLPGLNEYEYAESNPVNLSDPSGLWPRCSDCPKIRNWFKRLWCRLVCIPSPPTTPPSPSPPTGPPGIPHPSPSLPPGYPDPGPLPHEICKPELYCAGLLMLAYNTEARLESLPCSQWTASDCGNWNLMRRTTRACSNTDPGPRCVQHCKHLGVPTL